MVKLKKKRVKKRYFVILLTIYFFNSCKVQNFKLYEIEGQRLSINEKTPENIDINNFITPYKNHITKDLDSTLAYNPINQDKSKGKWETNIGNLFSETVLSLSNPIFKKQENKTIDFCLLNHGGIRSMIPKGKVTKRTAFEIMPFENSVMIVGLNKEQIFQLGTYFLNEKKPHPIANLTIITDSSEQKLIDIKINNKEIEEGKTYYVATSDYLANGGDNMLFLKESNIKYDINYKIRNLFIDYFKTIDTLPNITTKRVIVE